MKTARLVDETVSDRVLVFGSLPPHARDLDLLVRSRERDVLEQRLRRDGWLNAAREWVRFDGCSAAAIDLVPAGDWGIDPRELDALFAEATPVTDHVNLVAPAPHHVLLISARRLVRGDGDLDDKRRDRVADALREQPDGWDRARERADAWNSRRALYLLERTYKSGVPARARERAAALAELRSGRGITTAAKAYRSAVTKKKNGAVVAFSGLDGSGKSSQAEALAETLRVLGYDPITVWTRLSYNPSLNVLARPLKRALLLAKGRTRATPAPRAGAVDNPWRAAKELRRESGSLTWLWSTIVAGANAVTQRRVVRYHLRRGRIVLCDRYTLDSAVHLRYRYGSDSDYRTQSRLVEIASPRPLRAFWLDVPAEVAYERKAEQYDLDQLKTQVGLYEQEYERLGVTRLDGTRPRDELCEEVAGAVWRALKN